MWEIVGHRWHLEDNVPTLYVSYPGKGHTSWQASCIIILSFYILLTMMHAWLLCIIIMKMQQAVPGFPLLNMPDVCTASPLHKQAFCSEHCQLLRSQSPPIPTELHAFIEFCKQRTSKGINNTY